MSSKVNAEESSYSVFRVSVFSNRSSRRLFFSVFVACILTSLLVLGIFVDVPVAHAGNSGQQLQVTCSLATSIAVIGINQDGAVTTQAFYPDTSGGSTFTTSNWWWSGDVAILWYGPNGYGRFYDSVPSQQTSDIYATDCNNPPAQYNSPADVDGAMCDPATASPEQTVTCLGAAPLDSCNPPLTQPCVPYLSTAYITTDEKSFFCLMNGISTDINLDDPANPEANKLSSPYPAYESVGSTTLYWRIWGISYKDVNGIDSSRWYNNGITDLQTLTSGMVLGPYYVTGTMGAGFTCDTGINVN